MDHKMKVQMSEDVLEGKKVKVESEPVTNVAWEKQQGWNVIDKKGAARGRKVVRLTVELWSWYS